MGEAYSTYQRDEKRIQFFSEETEGKRPLRTIRYRWKDNIRFDLKKIGWEIL
jgi:hypothetical protein